MAAMKQLQQGFTAGKMGHFAPQKYWTADVAVGSLASFRLPRSDVSSSPNNDGAGYLPIPSKLPSYAPHPAVGRA